MALFDFISGDDFRASLESDYRELTEAVEHGLWKCAHVLAGSIIEAVLLDHLQSSGYQPPNGRDLLKMDLGTLIEESTKGPHRVLSEKTQKLSIIVKDYRNLIHSGRVLRLKEKADGRGSAVAVKLTEMIVEEVAAEKEKKYGLTAEQIIIKLEHDSSVLPILERLLARCRPAELERLLISLLPGRYYNTEPSDFGLADRIEKCFKSAYQAVDSCIRRKVAEDFVELLKTGDGDQVRMHEETFFRPDFLKHLSKPDRELVTARFGARFEDEPTAELLRSVSGIGVFLDESDLCTYIMYLVNAVLDKDKLISKRGLLQFRNEFRAASATAQELFRSYLDGLKAQFESESADTSALRDLLASVCVRTSA